ncbi:MAG TPA: hypothetical protein VG388_10410 [Solirubrobacteraceae bacterium]|nr:hypothetical protein [Solirubrobacteraceae bacterium]
MTANGLLGELSTWTGLVASPPSSTTPATAAAIAPLAPMPAVERLGPEKIDEILNLCDSVVGETSLRRHVFDWLVAPGGREGLPVDAYYPSRDLVVLCQEQTDAYREVYAELVPAHGLGLLTIDLGKFRADAGHAFSLLLRELQLVCDAMPPVVADAALSGDGAVVDPAAQPSPPPAASPPPAPSPPPAASPPHAPSPWPSAPPSYHPPPPSYHPPPPSYRPAPPPTAAPRPAFPAPPPPPGAPPAFPPPPPPYLAAYSRHPSAQQPVPVQQPVPPGAFQSLVTAVQRFTAAPQPFTMPPEPAGPGPIPSPAPAPIPNFAPPPLPNFAPPPLQSPAPPPLQSPAPPPLPRPAPPPLPRPAPAPMAPPVARTPYPLERQAPRVDPVLAGLMPAPNRRGRRVGQRQAEAAARAARFVEARGTRTRSDVVPSHHRPAPDGPWAPEHDGAPPAPAFAGLALPAPKPRLPPRSTARAQALQRALAHARTAPDRRPAPYQRPGPAPKQAGKVAREDVIALGLVVASVTLIELIFGVLLAFGGGPIVLGFGLLLDGGARALGTLAAVRGGKAWGSGWPWACGLLGSPAVAAFAFGGDGALSDVELAPVAGPLAAVALLALLIGLAGLPAGV